MWEMNIGNDHRKVQILLDSKPNDRFWPWIQPVNATDWAKRSAGV
jgi:hypothetical protein